MRRILCLLAALLALPSLGSDAPKEYDGAAEADDIRGTWRLTAIELDGRGRPLPFDEVMIYHAGNYTAEFENGRTIRRGNYRTDPAHTPPHLDWSPFHDGKVQVLRMIYQIDGDTLTIAFRTDDQSRRPEGFDDKKLGFWTYRRVK
jgi:uncharacterized protein (TIGR03067 family)